MSNETHPLRDRIAEALYRREWPNKQVWQQALAMDREVFEAMADAVLAVLPAAAPTPPGETAAAVLAVVEAALGDTLLPAAREEALAGIAAVLPATTDQTADRRAVLREAADRSEVVALRLRLKHDYGAANGAYEVAADLRRMADETQPAEPEAQQEVAVDTLARLLSDADVYVNHGDYPGWDDLAESGEQQYRQAARYLLKRLHITERQPAAGVRQDGATCPHGPERHGPEAGCIECRCASTTGHDTERQDGATP